MRNEIYNFHFLCLYKPSKSLFYVYWFLLTYFVDQIFTICFFRNSIVLPDNIYNFLTFRSLLCDYKQYFYQRYFRLRNSQMSIFIIKVYLVIVLDSSILKQTNASTDLPKQVMDVVYIFYYIASISSFSHSNNFATTFKW